MSSGSISESPQLVRAGRQVYVMPGFIHDYGDDAHHESMMRTCKRDEYGGPIRGTGPPDWRYSLHEFLDEVFFYPFRKFLNLEDNKARLIHILDNWLVTPLWGLNCDFPSKDVLLYTIWAIRGCKPIQVFEKMKNGRYRQIYPTASF